MDKDRQAAPPSLEDADTLGEALRAARATSGRSLAELSAATRVHPKFLVALEQGDHSVLPSRIFSLGYVRIYAQVLGLDELVAVERFKREFPEPAAPLQPPTGAALRQVRGRSPLIFGVVAAVAVSFIAWNVFQRLILIEAPHPSNLAAVPKTWAPQADANEDAAPVLGAPRPAPPDQTVPPMYVTRGLEQELTGIDPNDPSSPPAPAPPVQAAFNPRGALYGAPATNSLVVIQARKPAVLVVRQGDGRVLFARQLAAGDSWRAPMNVQAAIDASEPEAFDIYMNGEHSGVLTASQTPLGGLNARAAALARQSEARAAAAAEAQARTRAAAALPAAPVG